MKAWKQGWLAVALGLAGCQVELGPVDEETGTLEAELRILDNFDQNATVFNQGEEIQFLLTLTNTNDTAQTVRYRACPGVFSVFDVAEDSVYPRDDVDPDCSTVIDSVSVPANGEYEFTLTWDQLTDADEPVDVGTYTVYGFVWGSELEGEVPSRDFTIQ